MAKKRNKNIKLKGVCPFCRQDIVIDNYGDDCPICGNTLKSLMHAEKIEQKEAA